MGFEGIFTFSLFQPSSFQQFLVRNFQVDRTGGNIDLDDIPVLYQSDTTACSGFGRDVANGKSRGTTRKTSIRNQGALCAKMSGFDIGCGIEHLLHTGTTFGPFIHDHYHIACLHVAVKDTRTSIIL
ncbi:hypothetical protein SDC9_196247 [bioreactor metagenome]|uniref:Uncharacterized protein n=1 Tax=bioreactor metagenome TaxID=1076179 RepID=A0A645ICJ7_9ZZZZ